MIELVLTAKLLFDWLIEAHVTITIIILKCIYVDTIEAIQTEIQLRKKVTKQTRTKQVK